MEEVEGEKWWLRFRQPCVINGRGSEWEGLSEVVTVWFGKIVDWVWVGVGEGEREGEKQRERERAVGAVWNRGWGGVRGLWEGKRGERERWRVKRVRWVGWVGWERLEEGRM